LLPNAQHQPRPEAGGWMLLLGSGSSMIATMLCLQVPGATGSQI
jgi:hypothetical protein